MEALDKWHKTRAGLLVFGLVELLLAAAAATWAIDNGNILLYVATIVLVVGGLQNLIKLVIALIHGNRQTN